MVGRYEDKPIIGPGQPPWATPPAGEVQIGLAPAPSRCVGQAPFPVAEPVAADRASGRHAAQIVAGTPAQ